VSCFGAADADADADADAVATDEGSTGPPRVALEGIVASQL